MRTVICAFLDVYLVVLIARAILSWFPIRPDSPVAPISRLLYDLTEPLLAPLRRIIPPAGMLDLSFIVLFFAVFLLQQALCG